MKYSKKKRKEIYNKILKYYQFSTGKYLFGDDIFKTQGICIVLMFIESGCNNDEDVKNNLPELYSVLKESGYKGKGYVFPLFEEWGHIMRIMIIQEALKRLK